MEGPTCVSQKLGHVTFLLGVPDVGLLRLHDEKHILIKHHVEDVERTCKGEGHVKVISRSYQGHVKIMS